MLGWGLVSDKDLMHFRVLLLQFLALFFAVPAVAQLADLYANFSKVTFETIHSCPQLKFADFTKSITCTQRNSADNLNDLAQINEDLFFAEEAHDEAESLKCAIRKASSVEKNADALQKIAQNLSDKIKIAIPLYQELQEAQAQMVFRKNAKIKRTVEELEGALAAVVASSWQGNSRTISKFFMEQVQAGSKNEAALQEKITAAMPDLAGKVKSEYEQNHKTLMEQKKSKNSWDLSTEAKQMLLRRAQNNDSFAQKFPDSPNLAQGLECRLEAKYGKGQEYADNFLLAGTLVATGGSALLARGAFTLHATIARGVALGRVSQQAGQVMIKAAIGLNTGVVLAEVDKHCLSNKQDFNTTTNMCSAHELELAGGEIHSLEQSNCLLAIALSGAPLPVIAAAGKSMRKLQIQNLSKSLHKKGHDYLYRRAPHFSVSGREMSKYVNESEDYIKSMGGTTERVQQDLITNHAKVQKSAALADLREELAAQEKSQSLVVNTPRENSLDSALYSHMSAPEMSANKDSLQKIIREMESSQPASSAEEALLGAMAEKSMSREEKINLLKDQIKRLENEVEQLPDVLANKPLTSIHEASPFGIHLFGKSEKYTPLKIVKLPTVKGPASYDTPALLHPKMQEDLDELQRLGVDVRIDPLMKVRDDRVAFYYGDPTTSTRVINIGTNAPYEVFKHEKTHALYERYIQGKLDPLKEATLQGKSIESVLTPQEIKGFGETKVKRLAQELKKENTDLAINERMAVDSQLSEMGLMRYSPSAVETEAYALRHQIEGYQKILKDQGTLNSVQQKEYNKTLTKAGLLVSYQDGAKEAARFLKAATTPSMQSLQATALRLAQARGDRNTSKETYFFDKSGRVLVLQADGTWKRFDAK